MPKPDTNETNKTIDMSKRIIERSEPGDTLIVARVTADGGMIVSVAGTRPFDMVDVARSLLDQACDRADEQMGRDWSYAANASAILQAGYEDEESDDE